MGGGKGSEWERGEEQREGEKDYGSYKGTHTVTSLTVCAAAEGGALILPAIVQPVPPAAPDSAVKSCAGHLTSRPQLT